MNRDFTLNRYQELCSAIVQSGYNAVGVKDYLLTQPKEKNIIMRHDVDKKPGNALKMAKLEKALGITSTYYFRSAKDVFNPDIIKEIEKVGHEVGYHYEVLDKAKGNFGKAIKIFEEELNIFKEREILYRPKRGYTEHTRDGK